MTDTGTDQRAHGWFIIDNELIDDYKLTPHTGWLYCAIVRHVNKTSGVAFPSLATLAKETCMGKSTVTKHLDILEEKKLISRTLQFNEKGDCASTHYRLLPVKKVGVVHQVDKGIPASGQGVVHQVDTKETKVKETKEKEKDSSPAGDSVENPSKDESVGQGDTTRVMFQDVSQHYHPPTSKWDNDQYLYIGRANNHNNLEASKWANPFKINKDQGRDEVIDRYRYYIRKSPELMAALPELKGKTLVCWCKPDEACHGDVLIELVDAKPDPFQDKNQPDAEVTPLIPAEKLPPVVFANGSRQVNPDGDDTQGVAKVGEMQSQKKPDPPAPPAKEKATPPTHKELFGAICDVLGWNDKLVAKKMKARIGKAATELAEMTIVPPLWQLGKMQAWAKKKFGDKWNMPYNLGSPEKVVDLWPTYCGETKGQNIITITVPRDPLPERPPDDSELVSPEQMEAARALMRSIAAQKTIPDYDPDLEETRNEEYEWYQNNPGKSAFDYADYLNSPAAKQRESGDTGKPSL